MGAGIGYKRQKRVPEVKRALKLKNIMTIAQLYTDREGLSFNSQCYHT